MTLPAIREGRLPAMCDSDIQKIRDLDGALKQFPQVNIATHHLLHGGMYARTICIPAGAALTGVFIRVPTLLVLEGDATVSTGDDATHLAGYHVLAGSAGRKQAFLAHANTRLTMVFATQVKTVAEAEDEFTNEAHLLFSRRPDAVNHVTITGE